MTYREWALVKEAIAQTRHHLGDRVAPGPQDSWRGRRGVTLAEAQEIRKEVRNRINRVGVVR